MVFDIQSLLDQRDAIAQGVGQTVFISTVSTALALLLGLVILGMLQSPWGLLRGLCRAYVEFFRNTPLLIHLYMLYKGLPYLGLTLDPVMCGIIGLSLQTAAYMSEIYRAGIEAVPRQQTESGLSLGLSRTEVLFGITLPQALRLILPPLGNQMVGVFKNSSLVAFITVPDIFFVVYEQSVTYFHYLEYFTLGLAIYMVLTLMTTAVMMGAERCLPWLFVQLEWAMLTLIPLLKQRLQVISHSETVSVGHTITRSAVSTENQRSEDGTTSPLMGLARHPLPESTPCEVLAEFRQVTQDVDALCSTAVSMQSPFTSTAVPDEGGAG